MQVLSKFTKFSFAAVVATALLGYGQKADAALIAYICDDSLCTGGGDTIVTDQGAGDNFPGSAQVGQINSGALSVAGFTIVTNVSQSKPLIGSAAAPQLDITFSAVTNDNLAHTVYLFASDTGFTGSGPFTLSVGGTQPPPGTNSIAAAAFGGTSNTNLDLTNMLAFLAPTSASPFSSSTTGTLAPSVNPYSLSLGIAISRSQAGTTTGDLNFQTTPAVPEPASVLLFGTGLAGVATIARRRFGKNKK